MKRNLLAVLSNRILFILIFSITVVLFFFSITIKNLLVIPLIIHPLSTACWFGIGPLFYIYAKASLDTSFRVRRIHLAYFLFPLYNLFTIVVEVLNLDFGFHLLFKNFVNYSYTWLFMYLLHSIFFVIASIRIIKKSNSTKTTYLLNFFYPLLVTLVVFSFYVLIQSNETEYYDLIERVLVIVFAAFILQIGIRSIRNSSQFSPAASKKYSYSTLSISEGSALLIKLKQVVLEQKPYLNQNLSLASLSKITSIKENDLSQLFSQHLKSSFYEFIRDLRLKEVEKRLEDPRYSHIKIASIAEDSGFKSRSAFYRAFKEKHGIPPSRYLKKRR